MAEHTRCLIAKRAGRFFRRKQNSADSREQSRESHNERVT